jgi:hypothetical protein
LFAFALADCFTPLDYMLRSIYCEEEDMSELERSIIEELLSKKVSTKKEIRRSILCSPLL